MVTCPNCMSGEMKIKGVWVDDEDLGSGTMCMELHCKTCHQISRPYFEVDDVKFLGELF